MDDKFVVPYQQNRRFTGRKRFLNALKEKLFDQVIKQYNYRIALYGMGGIGKTQTALEYVYTNKTNYDRIYWITAVDQASLLSGYQKIAKKAGLRIASDSSPVEIAEYVLSWLQREQNWLIVIDNLDDINVIDGFLPETGPHQHTLITTRNPNSAGIPAEGLEVPLLDSEDAVDLLSTLSAIDVVSNSPEREQADQIVEKLGYLPLGIEQAAAYVREVTGDFVTFLKDYDENRKDLHRWIPQGIRPYPHSVATTWSMSFNIVRRSHTQAAELFRLLSFLNPDGIVIGFLQSGAEVLENDLRQVVSNRIDMAKALIELEKFSLLKWDRLTKTLSVHRLVQMVMKDEMSDTELRTFRITVIDLCDQSFPREWNNKNRPLCRLYIGQVVGPLLNLKILRTKKSAGVMHRVGRFLRDDGKISDSEQLLLQAIDIHTEISGLDHPDTLTIMNDLAETYWAQGKRAESAALHEEVLEKNKRILGKEHPNTFKSMNNLAWTYLAQGKTVEAAALLEVLEKRKRILGDEHPDTLTTMDNLASTYRAQGKTTEAAALHEVVLEKSKQILGDEHPDTLAIMNNLAETYWAQGETAEAATLHEEVIEKTKRILGKEHPNTLTSMNNLAWTYREQGKMAEAATLLEEVLEKRKRIHVEKTGRFKLDQR